MSKDSAADRAGIRLKDLIVAINNQPASSFTLQQLTQLLSENGRTINLRIKRSEKILEITLGLRSHL